MTSASSLPPIQFFLTDAAKQSGFTAPRSGDAGFDLRASVGCVIEPGTQVLVPTGLHFAIPLNWAGIIKDRSSMASKRIYTHGGVIDAGYRGEVKVLLSNAGSEPYRIESGDKIAQMVVIPHLSACDERATLEELGTTDRGSGGFGSTGRV